MNKPNVGLINSYVELTQEPHSHTHAHSFLKFNLEIVHILGIDILG